MQVITNEWLECRGINVLVNGALIPEMQAIARAAARQRPLTLANRKRTREKTQGDVQQSAVRQRRHDGAGTSGL